MWHGTDTCVFIYFFIIENDQLLVFIKNFGNAGILLIFYTFCKNRYDLTNSIWPSNRQGFVDCTLYVEKTRTYVFVYWEEVFPTMRYNCSLGMDIDNKHMYLLSMGGYRIQNNKINRIIL